MGRGLRRKSGFVVAFLSCCTLYSQVTTTAITAATPISKSLPVTQAPLAINSGAVANQSLGAASAVAVCLTDTLGPVYSITASTTTAMFARIGVSLGWRDARHCPSGALRISLSDSTPTSFLPGALAYTMPYEGTHIVVFLDRVKSMVGEPRVPVLLAHVFAHEITHILQGISRHSESGLMKAKWGAADYHQMAWEPLPFTALDIELIHDGMANRATTALPKYHSEAGKLDNR
jgi:hypothetical protein